MHGDKLRETLNAVRRAQKTVEEAQSSSTGYTEAHNQLMFAEELLTGVQPQYQNGSKEEQRQLQQATDLLRRLKETQQSLG